MRRASTHLIRLPLSDLGRAVMAGADRTMALLEVADGDGARGFGVCAPLAGTHQESLDESLAGLRFWSSLCSSMVPLGLPSADFAISMAEMQLRGSLMPARESIRVATFVQGGATEVDVLANVGAFEGVSSVKLKVGRDGVDADRRAIHALLAAVEPQARLRLDANRRLTVDACAEMLHGFDPDRIEYVEDPLANPWELRTLVERTGIAIALDETALEWTRGEGIPDSIAFAPYVTAHVLRLSCVGRIDRSLHHARLARERGIRSIASTAYESNYALMAAAIVASQIDPEGASAHGLGTAHFYAQDLMQLAPRAGERMVVEPLPTIDHALIGALQ